MFGRHPRLMTAVGGDLNLTKDTYLDNFHTNLKIVWAKAKENIERKKEMAIKRHEESVKRRVKEIEYKVGDQVLIKYERLIGKHNRTVDEYVGPFEVVEVRDTTLVVKRRRKTTTINKSDVKLFIADSP